VRRGRRQLCVAAALAVAGAGALGRFAAPALGKAAVVLPYPVADVWPSAVRFVRIDRGYTVREKDAETAYVLFDFVEGTRNYKGALELVRIIGEDNREHTRAVFSVPDMPRHYEALLADKLALKVKDDLGTPPAAPPRREPPRRDAGASAGAGGRR
jgi:hypothetical protein